MFRVQSLPPPKLPLDVQTSVHASPLDSDDEAPSEMKKLEKSYMGARRRMLTQSTEELLDVVQVLLQDQGVQA
jgi:hypothetical protein